MQNVFKKYKIGFDVWGLVLFFIIMIPNFIWFAIPAPNDILRAESVTKVIDVIASISQVIMIITLCLLIKKDCEKRNPKLFIFGTIICCMLYFSAWIFYYNGVINSLIILLLCITPCLSFLFYAIKRNNMIAVVPTGIFMVCHWIYAVVNYII